MQGLRQGWAGMGTGTGCLKVALVPNLYLSGLCSGKRSTSGRGSVKQAVVFPWALPPEMGFSENQS